ncbi:ethanolamine permease [Terrimicrobium sacchariphilum]|uniref:Ethanolamine permease n=2 Tax=Terrimicrobium sacchariphilum TaxID=690879 RepID=A0A146G4I5_TERSA|nr:ethanolamine permease [Terrimicrobium sacchariphilum]
MLPRLAEKIMSDKQTVGGVTYKKADSSYFEKRKLRRHARVWSLWALGVGAVISGHFSGWNFGIGQGGWGGLFIAAILIAIMYLGLIFSLAEMSPALPHTGGAYSFARSAMGPWGGFITGLAESIEYIMTPAVIVFFIGSYMSSIFGTPSAAQPLWWIGAYIVFVALNYWGVELSFKFSVTVTLMALGVLVIFWISAIPHADFTRWALNIGVGPDGNFVELPNGGGSFLPKGIGGALAALPFAVWLFLAIEELPLAAEESHDPKKDMPKGLILGMFTLIFSAVMVMVLNASIGGTAPGQMQGAFSLSTSAEPLLDGFRTLYGAGIAKLLALFAVIGLIASFHTIIFAFGRQIYSLSRAGYYLPFLSVTHGKRHTPHVAMFTGAGIGLAVLLTIWFTAGETAGGALIGGTLLNMAVFGAMLSYAFQGLSFILLRIKMPHIERPYRSPLGIPGAVATIVIAMCTLYYQLQDPSYVKGVYAALAWYLAGLAYFAFIGRHKLILSPEEEFAMNKGKSPVVEPAEPAA